MTTPHKEITTGLKFPEGPVAMPDGSVILVEIARETLTRVMPDGTLDADDDLADLGEVLKVTDDGTVQVRNTCVVDDKGTVFNQDVLGALELQFMLENAEPIVLGALERKESRGGHAREDYPTRDDVNFMRHTMAYKKKAENGEDYVQLDYKPVVITRYQPMERKY